MSATDTAWADPDGMALKIAQNISKLQGGSGDGELVYSPTSGHSYYRDFLARETGKVQSPGHGERLTRHAEQMEMLHKEFERTAYQRAQNGGLEFRVQPGRTDGYGGYFSPPAWLNELFATANRPGRVLSGLMARFPLPAGVSQINVPVIGTGTAAQPATDGAPAEDQDITDAASSSQVAPIWGQADISLQLLEQSPPGAYMDWVIFKDLTEAYDFDLEQQLLYGGQALGSTISQLTGVTQVSGIVVVAYTSASPTGSGMWPYLAKTGAQVGDARLWPPECWLMRTARWFWLQGSEDTATRPFGLSSAFYLGSDAATPNPIGGLMGLPVFLNDAIPANLGAAATQDEIVCLRPTDSILLESAPQTLIDRETGSGALGLRLQLHCNVAAITARRPAGIGVANGTGFAVQSGY
jgi:hypothetical protein